MLANPPTMKSTPRSAAQRLTRQRARAFTLIEILVVIAIIAILMGLLIPAVSSVINNAAKAKAKSQAVMLANAISAYRTEYGRLPVVAAGGDEANEGWFQGPQTGGQYNKEVVKVLMGEDYKGLNPRKQVFFEPDPAKGDDVPKGGVAEDGMLYDPWGTPYGIKMDTSYNQMVEYYGQGSQENIPSAAIVVSFGKNKIQQDIRKTTDKGKSVDDVVSFR